VKQAKSAVGRRRATHRSTVSRIDYKSTGGHWSGLNNHYRDNWVAKFEGYMTSPHTGTYTFYTNSDDGSFLYIDNHLVVNNDGLHGMRTKRGSKRLNAGSAKITVWFFERGGGAGLHCYWELPGTFGKTLITSSHVSTKKPSSPPPPSKLISSLAFLLKKKKSTECNSAQCDVQCIPTATKPRLQCKNTKVRVGYWCARTPGCTGVEFNNCLDGNLRNAKSPQTSRWMQIQGGTGLKLLKNNRLVLSYVVYPCNKFNHGAALNKTPLPFRIFKGNKQVGYGIIKAGVLQLDSTKDSIVLAQKRVICFGTHCQVYKELRCWRCVTRRYFFSSQYADRMKPSEMVNIVNNCREWDNCKKSNIKGLFFKAIAISW